MTKSPLADLVNTAGRPGGSCNAAAFLKVQLLMTMSFIVAHFVCVSVLHIARQVRAPVIGSGGCQCLSIIQSK